MQTVPTEPSGSAVTFQEPELQGRRAGLAAGVHLKLAENRRNVMVDSAAREEQPLRYLGVAEPRGHQAQHLQFSSGQDPGEFPVCEVAGPRVSPRTPRSRASRATKDAAYQAVRSCCSSSSNAFTTSWAPAPCRQGRELAAGLRRDVDDRAERACGEERLTGTDEDARTPAYFTQKRADERALADSRLAAQKQETSLALARALERGAKRRERLIPFEQSDAHCSDDGETENPSTRQGFSCRPGQASSPCPTTPWRLRALVTSVRGRRAQRPDQATALVG